MPSSITWKTAVLMQFCHTENHCSMTLHQSRAKHVVACVVNGHVSNSLLSFLDLSTVAYQRKDFHCWWLMIEDLSLVHRCCQNIERTRAKVSQSQFAEYFSNLEKVLTNPDGSKVPPSNIFSYDETNLSDDPGTKKCLLKRGLKYPDRVQDSSKSSTCGSADGMSEWVSEWEQFLNGTSAQYRLCSAILLKLYKS